MAKYLIAGTYTAEGASGVLREGGTGRRAAAEAALGSVGGSLESFHFALDGDEWYVVAELPDNVTAAAIALIGTASGALRSRAIALITPEEMDAIVDRLPQFRPPGD
jgi:uncharacterized protein with GYD domain